jgi:hypothetical protein
MMKEIWDRYDKLLEEQERKEQILTDSDESEELKDEEDFKGDPL